MFLIIQLYNAALDRGIARISIPDAIGLLALILAIPMIPYVVFSLRRKLMEGANEVGEFTGPMNQPLKKHFAWLHWHRPVLHH